MDLRELKQEDIGKVVEIHKKAFEGFFLTSLGPDFLRTYYGSAIDSNLCSSIALLEDREIKGFAIIANNSKGFNSFLVKENLKEYISLGVKMIFTRPMSLIRLLKNFTKTNGNSDDDQNYSELLSIGVDPSIQGRGVGKTLLSEIEVVAKNKGIAKIVLTTDFYNNENAVAFYHKVGYNVFYDFIAYPDRKMYKMYKKLI